MNTPVRQRSPNGMACPHCGCAARARSGRTLSALYRERTYQCTNPDCGHSFIVGMEVMRTVSPSACPNPDVSIPLSDNARAACQQMLKTH